MSSIQNVGAPQVPVETLVVKNNKPVPQVPSFKATNANDEFVKEYEVKATTGKKWAVGLASAWCPGLGQAINGQWGKGFAYLLGYGALLGTSYATTLTGKIGVGLASALGALGVVISSVVNAVKNAKSTVHVVDEAGLAAANK